MTNLGAFRKRPERWVVAFGRLLGFSGARGRCQDLNGDLRLRGKRGQRAAKGTEWGCNDVISLKDTQRRGGHDRGREEWQGLMATAAVQTRGLVSTPLCLGMSVTV